MNINFNILLNKVLKEMLLLLKGDNKYLLAAISRLLGKSTFCKVLVTKWLLEPNNSIGYVCPSLKLCKKFFKDLVSVIPDNLINYNGTDLTVSSITGSTIYFFSAEQGNRIRGYTFDYLVLDECAFYKEDESNHIWYGILQPTIKVKGKKILMVSTPNGCLGFWYDLILKALKGNKNFAYIKRTIYDDESCKNIDEIKDSIPDLMFRLEYLCEFILGNNSFFTNYHNCYYNDLKFNFNSKLWFGIDWSSTGKDETILTITNELNLIILYKVEGTLDNKYKQLSLILNKYNFVGGYAEDNSIGSVMLNELNKLVKLKVCSFTTTNENKTEIITDLAILLEKEELYYNDLELDRLLGAFGYSISKTKKLTFEGKGEHDDRVMSLAICLRAKKKFVYNNKFIFV